MAKILVKVPGAEPREVDAQTVGEARGRLGLEGGHIAQLNGATVKDDQPLQDSQFLTFMANVKGGR